MSASGADIILLPKKLRAEWMDVMALDPELSPLVFRVACVVGKHLNHTTGDTFIAQETIARVLDISKRSVWGCLKKLEERGYLVIKRRQLREGPRVTDKGTFTVKYAGGKGVANHYMPAFERSQLSTTNSGAKLAAQCDLWWEQRSQNSASKVAADCDLTLGAPSGHNPLGLDSSWEEAGKRLAGLLSPELVLSWFERVRVASVTEEKITLAAPTKFLRDHLRQHFSEVLRKCFAANQVEIIVEAADSSSTQSMPSGTCAADRPASFLKASAITPQGRKRSAGVRCAGRKTVIDRRPFQ